MVHLGLRLQYITEYLTKNLIGLGAYRMNYCPNKVATLCIMADIVKATDCAQISAYILEKSSFGLVPKPN